MARRRHICKGGGQGDRIADVNGETEAAASPPPGWRQGANAALYRSDDGGEHWVRLEQGRPPQFDAMVRQIAMNDAGTVFAAAGPALFASHDEGDSW